MNERWENLFEEMIDIEDALRRRGMRLTQDILNQYMGGQVAVRFKKHGVAVGTIDDVSIDGIVVEVECETIFHRKHGGRKWAQIQNTDGFLDVDIERGWEFWKHGSIVIHGATGIMFLFPRGREPVNIQGLMER